MNRNRCLRQILRIIVLCLRRTGSLLYTQWPCEKYFLSYIIWISSVALSACWCIVLWAIQFRDSNECPLALYGCLLFTESRCWNLAPCYCHPLYLVCRLFVLSVEFILVIYICVRACLHTHARTPHTHTHTQCSRNIPWLPWMKSDQWWVIFSFIISLLKI
jgi:hypothetical protein